MHGAAYYLCIDNDKCAAADSLGGVVGDVLGLAEDEKQVTEDRRYLQRGETITGLPILSASVRPHRLVMHEKKTNVFDQADSETAFLHGNLMEARPTPLDKKAIREP